MVNFVFRRLVTPLCVPRLTLSCVVLAFTLNVDRKFTYVIALKTLYDETSFPQLIYANQLVGPKRILAQQSVESRMLISTMPRGSEARLSRAVGTKYCASSKCTFFLHMTFLVNTYMHLLTNYYLGIYIITTKTFDRTLCKKLIKLTKTKEMY